MTLHDDIRAAAQKQLQDGTGWGLMLLATVIQRDVAGITKIDAMEELFQMHKEGLLTIGEDDTVRVTKQQG